MWRFEGIWTTFDGSDILPEAGDDSMANHVDTGHSLYGNWCLAVAEWPQHSQSQFFLDSLVNHIFFTLSSLVLVLLFITGIHNRVVAPSIVTRRSREVLADFNMSCDDTGKLILKPRPAHTWLNVFQLMSNKLKLSSTPGRPYFNRKRQIECRDSYDSNEGGSDEFDME